ncbi:DUF6265 family protein [Mucilaginibacter phyllosphaerae]|uniref:DUF6265 domain-containing protein n=1 Tax=Mucilaginibacter phyllosphaerae TaxID=1812349 RepID=A0A4Y8ADG5_9SPHI|nr:DUF6265 family protein [Mucilaginibacter phyllosphaerae]MBB3969095.1 hypothetical protein [Mucilaginibacter phyllosphaerae]TEW66089.1 hypothetical protein E2R65_13295 [Mucilaginibacter phyllosphaerae]GGH06223.1 hypothetical protein GCM10007352_10400 [Mucilaginibacter phyllosphaerae]
MKKIYLFILLTASIAFNASAQQQKASINDLAFMAGTWTLKHEWGDMEEFWGKPMGDNMVSTFRCVKNGKVVFYEFMAIEQAVNGPVMKLRHFNKGSIGWEDKNKPYLMPAVKITANQVVFESIDKRVRITYKRISPLKMDCILDEKGKDGKWKKDVFAYTLSK